jgi:hypothetical protein
MNAGSILRAATMTIVICLAPSLPAQEASDDEVVRGFVSTRGTEVVTSGRKPKKTQPKPKQARPIGIGYTIFKWNPDGKPVRVDPSQEFYNGDKLRFVLETNVAGYLYIFHQPDSEPPKMIFPDHRLNNGANRIEAHSLTEAPSSEEPRYQWFNIVAPAATEHFYLVFARKPLPSVTSGDGLVAYCKQRPGGCPWRPSDETWKGLLTLANVEIRESRSKSFGDIQTEIERQAILRDVTLEPNDPRPSVIKVCASPAAQALMTMVDIIHK